MLSQLEQASLNLEQALEMRAAGLSYREIGIRLALTGNQLGRIRRALRRAKGARTRLLGKNPVATERDLPIAQSVLPAGLRQILTVAGYHTLGDVVDRLADPQAPGLETLPGLGPHRVQLVMRLLNHVGLLPGPEDLRAAVEALFPDLQDGEQAVAQPAALR